MPKKVWWLTGMAAVAGLLYNSWPLGYWLNPAIAKSSLASELEGLHQPFAWFFIACDVVSSVLLLVVAALLWTHKTQHPRVVRIALIGLTLYSLLTILDALLPLHCDPTQASCPSYKVDHLLLAHGLASIFAGLFLCMTLVALWWCERKSVWLNALMVGYIAFSIFSVFDLFIPTSSNLSQHYYLILCGVVMAVVPYSVYIDRAIPEPAVSDHQSAKNNHHQIHEA